jgi:hypothetical protein
MQIKENAQEINILRKVRDCIHDTELKKKKTEVQLKKSSP